MKTEYLLLFILGIVITTLIPAAFAHHTNSFVVMRNGSSSIQACAKVSNCFALQSTLVPPGGTVTWTNLDTVAHTVTSGKSTDNQTGTIFNSGLIKPKGTFSFTFNDVGTFDYFCAIHPWMTGIVNVSNEDVFPNSKFLLGATIEPDQVVYTWTDRSYITVVAPDYNFDPNSIDFIDAKVSTKEHSLSPYKLVETGVDTGIFTGYVILTGDANLKDTRGVDGSGTQPTAAGPSGVGPTDGFLPSEDSDGVSVSFEFTRDQTVTGSALTRWNIGEIKWLEASYPANGQGVLQIVDPDMNLNPKAVDKFDTNVWSDSDSGGIKLTMTETGEATGIFQGKVQFTDSQSSGNNLQVKNGDTVTAVYDDRTLPAPCTVADDFKITDTTFIGTVAPPKTTNPKITPCVVTQEKSLVMSNPRFVDALGHPLQEIKLNQQVMISADLTNNQQIDQPFVYMVQIEDESGKTTYNQWVSSKLNSGQTVNVAQSWITTQPGKYLVKIFVMESIDGVSLAQPAQLEAFIAGSKPDFTIGVDPNSIQIDAGKTAISKISIISVKGNIQEVSLSCNTNIPSDKGNCKVVPSTIKPGETAVMTIYSDKTIQPTDYKVTIIGTAQDVSHTSLVSLNVQPVIVKPKVSISPSEDSFDVNSEIPFSASFDDQYSDTISSFQWNFDDGQSETGQSVTHAFHSAGTHKVTLTVFYVDGDKSELTKYLTIKEKPHLTPEQAAAIGGGGAAAAAGGSWTYWKYFKIPKLNFTLRVKVRVDWK